MRPGVPHRAPGLLDADHKRTPASAVTPAVDMGIEPFLWPPPSTRCGPAAGPAPVPCVQAAYAPTPEESPDRPAVTPIRPLLPSQRGRRSASHTGYSGTDRPVRDPPADRRPHGHPDPSDRNGIRALACPGGCGRCWRPAAEKVQAGVTSAERSSRHAGGLSPRCRHTATRGSPGPAWRRRDTGGRQPPPRPEETPRGGRVPPRPARGALGRKASFLPSLLGRQEFLPLLTGSSPRCGCGRPLVFGAAVGGGPGGRPGEPPDPARRPGGGARRRLPRPRHRDPARHVPDLYGRWARREESGRWRCPSPGWRTISRGRPARKAASVRR